MKGITLILLVLAHFVLGQNPISLIQTPVRKASVANELRYTTAKIPLTITNGMPFVQAKMEGQSGIYLFDTGAPMLVINDAQPGKDILKASSVAGDFSVTSTTVKKFEWAGNAYAPIDAIATDLRHLEKVSDFAVAGIIGYEVIKNYELFLDYQAQQLALLNPKEDRLLQAAYPKQVIKLEMHNHLPIIEVEIDGKILRFALDTGAAANLLDEKYAAIFSTLSYTPGREEELRGIDQQIKKVTTAFMHRTNLGDTQIEDMKYLFTDLSHLEIFSGLRIDGLLGYPFFEKIKCSINYPKQVFYIW